MKSNLLRRGTMLATALTALALLFAVQTFAPSPPRARSV